MFRSYFYSIRRALPNLFFIINKTLKIESQIQLAGSLPRFAYIPHKADEECSLMYTEEQKRI